MHNNESYNSSLTAICLSAVFTISACSSSDGGGGTATSEPIGDINGQWAINETISSSTAACTGTDSYSIQVAQDGNAVTVSAPAGSFDGSINGNTLSWTGSYPEDGGTVTINSLTATVAADCNSFTAESSWTWTDGVNSCTGTTSSTGERLVASGC